MVFPEFLSAEELFVGTGGWNHMLHLARFYLDGRVNFFDASLKHLVEVKVPESSLIVEINKVISDFEHLLTLLFNYESNLELRTERVFVIHGSIKLVLQVGS